MGFHRYRCRVVCDDEKPCIFWCFFKDDANNICVNALDCLYLFFHVSIVRGFVRGFNMNIDDIVVFEERYGRIRLCPIIGIQIARCSLNMGASKPASMLTPFTRSTAATVAPLR